MSSSNSSTFRVAIVGSGPSGFFAAGALQKADIAVEIDIYEMFPFPYGLVRSGVAPDHPKIKSVTGNFEKIALSPDVNFCGNVKIGEDLSVSELQEYYDGIIFTNGADTDRKLGIPGEDLKGSYTATEFVGWYNGDPRYRDSEFDLSGERVVVIGQGNVAVDVARILAKTVDELKETDIAQHALDALSESKIKEIYLVGRRGPIQAAFTDKEIREMGELAECDVYVDPAHVELSEADQKELELAGKGKPTRNFPILQDFAQREPTGKPKRMVIDFFKSPVELSGETTLQKVKLEKNRLVGEPNQQKAKGTGESVELECSALFRSIGYRGQPLPGVPFDEKRGTYPNEAGRITEEGNIVPGLYVAGWIKRGPSGVIGTNKPDSVETVKSLVKDLSAQGAPKGREISELHRLLEERGVQVVSFEDWKRLDQIEQENGAKIGKPREKFTRVEEMLSALA